MDNIVVNLEGHGRETNSYRILILLERRMVYESVSSDFTDMEEQSSNMFFSNQEQIKEMIA